MQKGITLFFVFLGSFCTTYGQSDSLVTDTTAYNPKDDFSISAFPLVFYLPETGLAFGGVGITVFNIGKEKAWRKSSVQLGLAYTLKKQILIFTPYELYFKQKWKLNGELGYYRYFYNYYGIGVDSDEEDLETYDANFPRILSTLSYRVTPSFLLGVQYRFDHFDIPRTDSLLSANNPVGIDGGTLSTIGISASYDTRDDIFYPRKGVLANFTAEKSANYTGASFDYALIQLDVNYYQTIKGNHILATNFFTGSTIGDSPFFSYYYFSSGKRGRGFNDRRFIDKNISMLQVEYRFPIYKRFRGAAFSSIGSVGNTYGESFTNRKLWSYGGGLRFQLSKKQMSHVRLDVARSYEGFQFYVTIGEAF
ncbi:MAG: BamA/TamA family outer membrane protein [Crocinitomix sp.]|nr:BamA/TamA family outer membrane protein [Crocinitomix sp.]